MDNPPLSGLVTGLNMFSYIGEFLPQEHDDIAISNHLATLSADIEHDRYSDQKNWFEYYIYTMRYMGWSLYQDSTFTSTRHVVANSVADFLVESADAMKDFRQANAMIDTLDAMKSNNPAMLSFDSESRQGESFQIVPARYDSDGNLHIAFYKLELRVSKRKSSFLFWSLEEHSATIIQHKAYMRLDRNEMDRVRAYLKQKSSGQLMKRFDLRKNRLI
ncbi:hypothetical protein HU762_15895 [Pseudomonas sp. SWRI92]|uniref:hypothetical protein n=1 Tax=Pseudomonas sp. SWRI92 TaxID=2745499 RepID=UPI00164440C0|nr:hypothetical protein [Pseudomonas sp. SWRI92]MBC3375434.1 hypothetical protein [Pseudomonas sp. SWRI92]